MEELEALLLSGIPDGGPGASRLPPESLPHPVRLFLERSLVDGEAHIVAARLAQEGTFQMGEGPEGWRTFRAIEVFRAFDPAFCPAGRWNWSDVNIINKNITLQGAGIDKTEITITAARGIEATSSNSKPFRITGFTFTSSSNYGNETGMMGIWGGTQWRIDHNKFRIFSNTTGFGGNAIHLKDAKRGDNIGVYGLVDHNEFTDHPSSTGCWHVAVCMRGDGEMEWTWIHR